jgi:CDP-diacylglycerol--serine O-phosphatidyltransferase
MEPRFVGRLGLADRMTITNALLGFAAVVTAPTDPGLAARFVLLAAIADGADGMLARARGHTPVGDVLDSLADVVSFGVAPALLVFHIVWSDGGVALSVRPVLAGVAALAFLATALVRLGLYTTDDLDYAHTEGVQTTLAATLLASAYLAGVRGPFVLLAASAALAYLMVTQVTYPDLRARDALVMGVVQGLAIASPAAFGRAFPRILFVAACCYLLFGPWLYRRDSTDPHPAGEGTTRSRRPSESR